MIEQAFADGTRVTFLDRTDVGLSATPVRGHVVASTRFVGLVAHHTVMVVSDWDGDGIVHGDLDDIARFMRRLTEVRAVDLGPEVPYSFVVFRTDDPNHAIVAEGRGLGRTGAHTAGYNSTRYGVAYAGNTITAPVTPGVISAYRWIGTLLHDPAGAAATTGHRDHKSTACPGTNLYAALDQLQPPFDLTSEEDDMFTDEDRQMLQQINGELAGRERHQLIPRVVAIDERVNGLGGQTDIVTETVERVLRALPTGGEGETLDADVIAEKVADELAERMRA